MLDAVHRAAPADAWRRGVALVRRGACRVLECTPSAWLLRVAADDRERDVAWTWGAWRCDCGAGDPGAGLCEHIVAAACTLDAAGELLQRPPAPLAASARRGYRLRSSAEGLHLRVTRTGDAGDETSESSERLLTAEHLPDVLGELAQALDVTLDGRPVRVDPTPLQARAMAFPDGSGGRRQVVVAPEITGMFSDSPLVLCGDTLRRLELPAAEPPAPAAPAPARPPPPSEPEEDRIVTPERLTLEPHWRADESGFDLDFRAESGSGQVLALPADRVVRAWQSGTYALEGLDGGLAWLPQDWLARHGPILEQFVAARAAGGKLPQWARPAAAALCQALDAPPPPELAGLAALAYGSAEVPAAALPAGLRAELRDYQKQGVDWLCLLRDAGIGALLADDMGLGKTLQTLCAVAGRTLVIAPTSTLHNWAAEAARFRPDLRVGLYHGPKRGLDPGVDVTLTSYAVLRLDRELLAQESWDTLVLDEAQAIKEPTTATAAAAFSLHARWRVALSGTPVENRLTELWSLCHFLNPGLLGGRKDFIARHARRIEAGNERAARELQAKIRPFVLRRRKSEVARELPPRTDLVLRCTLDPQERAVYDSLRLATQTELALRLAAGLDTIEALELLLRLRQAACHVALVPGQQAARSSKLDLLLEQLTEIIGAGHRALVFSQ